MSRRVSNSRTVPSDVSGQATVYIDGPHRPWVSWSIASVVVASEPAGVPLPTCAVYRGAITPSGLLGESRSADSVTFQTAATDTLMAGEQLIVVVYGTEPGTPVTVNMTAEETDTP